MTHNQRLLELLSDYQPHTHHELYQLHIVAHSRVSDLRKQGHTIEQWRYGDDYIYQLVRPLAAVPAFACEPDESCGSAALFDVPEPPRTTYEWGDAA